MKDIFQYSKGDSIFHKMNPLTKLLLAFIICAAAFISSSILFLLFLLAFSFGISCISKTHKKAFAVLKGLFKISIFLFALQVLFVRSGNKVFWIITDEGVLIALKVVLRLMTACLPLSIVLAVTSVSDIANALVKTVHLPYKYAFTLTSAIRFIPQFMEEMGAVMEAQTARGVEFDTKNGFKKIGMMLPLCMPLLISSVRKADGTAVAAEVRGFNLRTAQSGYKSYPFALRDFIAILLCVILLTGAVMI